MHLKTNDDSLRGNSCWKTCFNTSYLCKKSKAKSKEAKPVACVSFKDLIKTYYFIDIDDDNRLQHSTVMCSSCRKRLERCQNGQKQNQDLQTDLAFLGIHLVWAWFRKTTVWVFCFEIKIFFFYFPTFRAWKIDQTRNFEAKDFILLLNERLNCLLKPQCAKKWTFIRILSCNPWRHRPTSDRLL